MDLQQVGGSHLDAALDVVEGGGDAAGEHGEIATEDGEEVRRLLALHDAHLHGAAPEALVQLHSLERGGTLLVLRAMAPLENVINDCHVVNLLWFIPSILFSIYNTGLCYALILAVITHHEG